MFKNIGQISGLWIGNYAPQNTTLIWFDTGNNIHKTYDFSSGVWIPISMNPIVNKTYAELQSLAAGNNIAQGTFYRITDLGYLALAITSTKIQYVDNNDNYIIDDLVSNKTYCVTSSNLLIDNLSGVWDIATNTLKFNFTTSPINANADDDFVFGSRIRSGVHSLSKYRLKGFVSSKLNNSLIWNEGVYLNFLSTLQSYYNQNGGVVRYETYASAIQNINQSLNILQSNITNINIWNKTIPSPFTPFTTPSDIDVGDTLKVSLRKSQSWFNKLKFAKGITLSSDYSVNNGIPSVGDTVEEAIGKLQYEAQGIPSGWNPSSDNSDPTISIGDSISQAFAKVQRWFNLFWHISVGSFYSRDTYDGVNPYFEFSSYSNQSRFTVKISDNNWTNIYGGKILQKYDNTLKVSFDSISPSQLEDYGSEYEYNISDYDARGLVSGVKDLIVYNTIFKEPNVANFTSGVNNQDVINSGSYGLFSESIISKVRSSKYQFTNSNSGDINVDINQSTPEFLYIRGVYTSNVNYDLIFNVNEVRDGQIINIIIGCKKDSNGGLNNLRFKKSTNAPSRMIFAFQYIDSNGQFTYDTSEHIISYSYDYKVIKLMCFHRSRELSPLVLAGSATDSIMLLK